MVEAAANIERPFAGGSTAAGRITPAKVIVVGAGVAGLAAIQQAKGMNANVYGFDVRAAAGEQVEAMGAKFLSVELDEDGDGGGGYAKEMSADYQKRQAELVAEHIAKQDIVICTALIPGRPAPELVTRKMVESMKPGSVLVDLAVEQGGTSRTHWRGWAMGMDRAGTGRWRGTGVGWGSSSFVSLKTQ